ncbi:hypothetical protein NPIL_600511 [Nephila pilipes]|uniref:Uncharacterized protein n=1 Tax=Nephila pilipes TaxID=299642 RepID=A0A8X6MVB3_NEPPI|nr:hypothetical protein NPIL_600511 [Nephila pilipes]
MEVLEKLDVYENSSQGLKTNSVTSNKPNFRSELSISERRFKSAATSSKSNNEKTRGSVFSKHTNLPPERRTIQCYGFLDTYNTNTLAAQDLKE